MLKAFDLTGKVALVTGGNGGIGLGLAQGLAQAGAAVEIWGTNAEKNERATEALAAHGGRVTSRIVDVTQEANVVEAMQALLGEHARLDACFANAGVSNRWKSFLDIGGADYRRVMAINVDGMLWTMREACRHMKARAEAGDPGGCVVAVSSMVAGEGAPRNEDYAASKSAVLGFVNGVAVEFGRYGVRCNALLPGWVATELTGRAQQSARFNQDVIGRVPVGRWGQPDDFAGIAVYLASDASAFHTGDAILIDGGYTKF